MLQKYFFPLLLAFSLVFSAQAKEIDRIVAVVNDDVITQLALDAELKEVTQQLQKRGTPLPPADVLKKQVLERMIMDLLHEQFAKEVGLKIDEDQLDRAIARIAQNNNMSLADFKTTIEKDGVDYKRFREEVRREILRARLKEREVDSKVMVTDAEIDNYLKNLATQEGLNEEYNIEHILVRIPDQASAEQIRLAREKAERARDALLRGADFGQIAAAYSDAQDALQGGALGWRKGMQLPSLFLDTLLKMKPGEISPVMQSPNGFHIVKLSDKRGANAQPLVEYTHVRHILIKTGEQVSEDDAKARLEQIAARIRKGADFGEEAKLHSDDSSAAAGGDLGWVGPGDTVTDFEKAMNSLAPGQISQPVHTGFGWHLIQVLGRRSEDASKEKKRQEARQAIAARKSDEAYQEWLRELRDRAYVEYHLDEK